MTNYEKIKTLTLEQMASFLVIQNDEYDYDLDLDCTFLTTDGNAFVTREKAEAHEVKWLNRKMSTKVFCK